MYRFPSMVACLDVPLEFLVPDRLGSTREDGCSGDDRIIRLLLRLELGQSTTTSKDKNTDRGGNPKETRGEPKRTRDDQPLPAHLFVISVVVGINTSLLAGNKDENGNDGFDCTRNGSKDSSNNKARLVHLAAPSDLQHDKGYKASQQAPNADPRDGNGDNGKRLGGNHDALCRERRGNCQHVSG